MIVGAVVAEDALILERGDGGGGDVVVADAGEAWTRFSLQVSGMRMEFA